MTSGYIPFRRAWLARLGLDPKQCAVIGVMGESMEPTLPDGCSILLDRSRKRRHAGHIYVLITDDGLVVKRLGKDAGGSWQLESDHPAWSPTPWAEGTQVIGEVKWVGMTL